MQLSNKKQNTDKRMKLFFKPNFNQHVCLYKQDNISINYARSMKIVQTAMYIQMKLVAVKSSLFADFLGYP
jgi:hypothetical protein